MHEPQRDQRPEDDPASQSLPDSEQHLDEWTAAEISARPLPTDPLAGLELQDAVRRLELFQEGQNLRRRSQTDLGLALAAGRTGDTERAMAYLRRAFRMALAANRSLDEAGAGLRDQDGQPLVDRAPQLVADIPYYYRAGPFAALACCRIRIWERYGEPPVVMATELPDNPGMSITNASEYLATDVWDLLGCPERGLVWIEHYPERGPAQRRIPEEFDRVTFTQTERGFAGPQWRRLSRAEVEALVGGPLEEGRAA